MANTPAGTSRQAAVAARGAQVMPFDLTRTTHTFTDLPNGGRETVLANDPNDAEQITPIRMHLAEEVEKFRRGDFADPAAIHGDDMPGLRVLRAGFGRITFSYEALPAGAAITYTSDDPAGPDRGDSRMVRRPAQRPQRPSRHTVTALLRAPSEQGIDRGPRQTEIANERVARLVVELRP
jgi:hypothetical protein